MIRIQVKYSTYSLVHKCNQVDYFMNGCTAVYQGVVGRHGIRCRPVLQNIDSYMG